MLFYGLIFSVLSYFWLLRPIRKEFVRVREQKMQADFYLFQLRQVRRMYPVLHDLSYEEIHERFNVREAYRSIR